MYNEQSLESNVSLITTPQKVVGDGLHVCTHHDNPKNIHIPKSHPNTCPTLILAQKTIRKKK